MFVRFIGSTSPSTAQRLKSDTLRVWCRTLHSRRALTAANFTYWYKKQKYKYVLKSNN